MGPTRPRQLQRFVRGDRVQLGATVLYFVADERESRAALKPIPAKTAPATGVDAHLATSRKLRNFAALIEITKVLMAVFGVPVPKPDDAGRAVRPALHIFEEVERFNEEQNNKSGVEIDVGIGLHTGPLIAENIGSDRKMEYAVIGDMVNAAKRVESLNQKMKTQVLVTRECYHATGNVFAVRELPRVQVKARHSRSRCTRCCATRLRPGLRTSCGPRRAFRKHRMTIADILAD